MTSSRVSGPISCALSAAGYRDHAAAEGKASTLRWCWPAVIAARTSSASPTHWSGPSPAALLSSPAARTMAWQPAQAHRRLGRPLEGQMPKHPRHRLLVASSRRCRQASSRRCGPPTRQLLVDGRFQHGTGHVLARPRSMPARRCSPRICPARSRGRGGRFLRRLGLSGRRGRSIAVRQVEAIDLLRGRFRIPGGRQGQFGRAFGAAIGFFWHDLAGGAGDAPL